MTVDIARLTRRITSLGAATGATDQIRGETP
jgi:hypothetical protein